MVLFSKSLYIDNRKRVIKFLDIRPRKKMIRLIIKVRNEEGTTSYSENLEKKIMMILFSKKTAVFLLFPLFHVGKRAIKFPDNHLKKKMIFEHLHMISHISLTYIRKINKCGICRKKNSIFF